MSDRGTAWSVTLNMKTVSKARCEDMIEQAKQANWGVQGQIEEGKEGTPHYQLLVKTPQVRFSALKKVFPTAHIEKARNVKALESYVHKDEGRLETMKTIEVKFVQFPEVRKKFFTWVIENGHQEVYDYEQKLKIWDEFISHSIINRIECDVIGVNPQYRSIIQRYWTANVIVAEEDRQEYIRRQTDRQTDSIVIPTLDIEEDGGYDEEEDYDEPQEDDEEGIYLDEGEDDDIGDDSVSDCSLSVGSQD